MNKLRKKDVSNIIKIFAELSGIYNNLDDKYRSLAYAKVMLSLKNNRFEGVGSSIQAKIDEIVLTGQLQLLEDLKNNPVIIDQKELLKIHGITVKFVKTHGLKSIEDLCDRVTKHTINLTNAQTLGLQYYSELSKKIPRAQMKLIGNIVMRKLNDIKGIVSMELVGSYRRGTSSSKDVDILVVSKNPNLHLEVQRQLKSIILGTFSSGAHKFSGVIDINDQERHLDIMYAHPNEYATSLLAFTGSAGFNRLLRLKAIELGMKLNEKGLYNASTNKKINTKTEADIFKKLDFRYVAPNSRSVS